MQSYSLSSIFSGISRFCQTKSMVETQKSPLHVSFFDIRTLIQGVGEGGQRPSTFIHLCPTL